MPASLTTLLATAIALGPAMSLGATATETAATTTSLRADSIADLTDISDTDTSDDALKALEANQTLQLAVVVNGAPTGKIEQFVIRNGALFAGSDSLRDLGLKAPAAAGPDGLISLGARPGFSTRVDQSSQTLYVTASQDFLVPTILGSGATAGYAIESGTGVVLNYDLIATSADGRQSGNGLFDGRLFSPYGVLSSGLLVQQHLGGPRDDARSQMVRLDTTYVYSDPQSMRRYRLGDFITGALPWTRAVRLGGAQVNSDFSMRPDLITFPVPSISSSAAVPSTVDVLVNGNQVLSGAVPSGPFEVPQIPVITGAGTISTTVTDALGRQVVTELPFYASSALLAPGLQTYSGEVGFVRRNWGIRSNDYGAAAGVISYRRGLSPYLTFEGHAETTRRLAMAGAGAVVNAGDVAIVNLAVAGSRFDGRSGGQVALGVQRITPTYGLGGSVIVANRAYGDIAAANGDPVATLQVNVNAGVSLSRFGSLGIAFTEIKRPGARDDGLALVAPEPEHSRILTASYSKQIGQLSLYANLFHDFGDRKRTDILVGLAIPLGRRTLATVSGQSSPGVHSGQVELTRNAVLPGDWGYRAFASAADDSGTPDHQFAQVTYKSQWGQVFGGVDRIGGHSTYQGELRGAVAIADGGLFASNHIDDSFAIVDTGAPGIRVRQENRDVGKTDSDGRLLVPDLRSFDSNQISIEPLDAPIDADVPVTKRSVRPQDRSGVIVKLPVRVTHGALLRLVDAKGNPVAVGSSATLDSTNAAVPVGYDGEAYVVDLQSHNELRVEQPDGQRCTVAFDFRRVGDSIPTLGPLVCRELAQ